MLRYSAVSALSVAISLVVLVFCIGVLNWNAVLSSSVAVAVATVPSYQLNRKWAWAKKGKSHLWKEITPFWAVAIVGWAFSTICVGWSAKIATRHHLTRLQRSSAIGLVFTVTFAVLWIIKFVFFNQILFGRTAAPIPPIES